MGDAGHPRLPQLGYWTALVTKAQREGYAEENLARQGFSCYLPKIRQASGGIARTTVMFTRYLFVRVTDGWEAMWSTRGVHNLLMCGLMPSRIRDREIDLLMAECGASGVLDLSSRMSLCCGDSVVIRGSALRATFAGMTAKDRVARVLLPMFCSSVEIKVPVSRLVVSPAAQAEAA